MSLSRRQILAGAASAAACAAMPAAAIATSAPETPAWTLTAPGWEPGTYYVFGDVVKIGNRLHICMRMPHFGSDEPVGFEPLRLESA